MKINQSVYAASKYNSYFLKHKYLLHHIPMMGGGGRIGCAVFWSGLSKEAQIYSMCGFIFKWISLDLSAAIVFW